MKLPWDKKEEWRWRWMYTSEGTTAILHRMATKGKPRIEPDEPDRDSPWREKATTVCGLKSNFDMPGILSRLGAPRCEDCCKKLGIPAGDGAPFNSEVAIYEANYLTRNK
jgi:hypothetical protein